MCTSLGCAIPSLEQEEHRQTRASAVSRRTSPWALRRKKFATVRMYCPPTSSGQLAPPLPALLQVGATPSTATHSAQLHHPPTPEKRTPSLQGRMESMKSMHCSKCQVNYSDMT
ncbi:hypothetical protein VPH35_044674 [Triticum aestivum]|uniref:Uncharacterized protein n=1 Tax=Triticum urartu TaxID=4572 RepID=A0A8R7TVL6_TRIUA